MQCTYHALNQVSFICIAPHKCKCQRKLCAECQYQHGVDQEYTIPINLFRAMFNNKLIEYKLDQKSSDLTKQRMALKSSLTQMEMMLKKIWLNMSKSIKTIFDWIEQENQAYINLINENTNLVESSYTDLEKMVSIIEGSKQKAWNDEKNSYMMELDKIKNQLESEVTTFSQKLEKEVQKILEEDEEYQKKQIFMKLLPMFTKDSYNFLLQDFQKSHYFF